ncbi:MAG: spermidine/putrescine ABC transporter substrate-binding protein, partial [Campylobacterales bacterium]|nr:spermidine/putrescine ABC transporter substrate-binding protein [Campylobacterales bacterium]
FTAKTGIKIVYNIYDSNEKMYEEISTGNQKRCDLVFPSADYVTKMIYENLLIPLDYSKISVDTLDKKFLNHSFDENNSYSLPYLWGTSGLLLKNHHCLSTKSWGDLWNINKKRSIILNNDMRDTFSIALKSLGYSINTTNEDEIKQAYLKLLKLIPLVKKINSQNIVNSFLRDGYDVGMVFNGDAFLITTQDSSFCYPFLKEGIIMWIDNIAIPKNAENIENAYKFINFLLEPKIATKISHKTGYATPNRHSKELLDLDIKQNQIMYPLDENLQNIEILIDIGEFFEVYEKYWREFLKEAKVQGVEIE